jgi:hypothetical protein
VRLGEGLDYGVKACKFLIASSLEGDYCGEVTDGGGKGGACAMFKSKK